MCISILRQTKPYIIVDFCVCMDKLRYYYSLYTFSSVGLVTRIRAGQEIFVYAKAFSPGMGPTLSPIQWISPPPTPGVKRRRREVRRSSPSRIEVKNMCRYTSNLPCSVWCAEMHVQRHFLSCPKHV
jgi:hypothetical protein